MLDPKKLFVVVDGDVVGREVEVAEVACNSREGGDKVVAAGNNREGGDKVVKCFPEWMWCHRSGQ